MTVIKKGQYYRYYEGNIYKIICVANDTVTNDKVVVYQDIESKNILTKPYEIFISNVEVDGKEVKRFQRVIKNPKTDKNIGYFWDDYNKEDFIEYSNEAYKQGFAEGQSISKENK